MAASWGIVKGAVLHKETSSIADPFILPLMYSPKRTSLLSPPRSATTPSKSPRRVTIGKLSNKVLLRIFRYYLDDSPLLWPRLVHICRKWRRIVFASQRALQLRLFCTYGTPVLKTLDYWPTLPIAVNFGGPPALDLPAPEDEDNIIAALKQSGRVNSINLAVTSSLLGKLSNIEGPFSDLEDLVLLSRDSVQLTLPSTFRWGPRLRSLHLTRVAFPALPQLLYSSKNLVDLQLHEVLNTWRISPATLVIALSGMAQLQSLSLHFLSAANHIVSPLPSGKRIILPALTHLRFRGNHAYLEGIVARIDAPGLRDIEVTFFNKRIFDVSKLSEFVDRIEIQKTHRRADILSSERAISISLTQPGAPTCLKMQVFCECEPLSGQVYSMAQICSHFSAFISRVEDLRINMARPSSGHDIVDAGRWLDLFDSFTGVKWFHMAGNLSTDIVLALQSSERWRKIVLPALHKLCIREPGPRCAPLRKAVVSFTHSRPFSGRFLEVEYERQWINELHGTGPFSQQAAIEILSDDNLLKIFLYCLDASPQCWPTLTHVCQDWRRIVLTSPRSLHLRLYYEHGTPVSKTLDCWPNLPIIVQYGGSPSLDLPAPEAEDNIVAALKQSDRVSSINLVITSSLLEKFSAISKPFLKLEELVLLSKENAQLALPSTFRWGPYLRILRLTGIAFPALPQLLHSSRNLVDLQLHEALDTWHIWPETLVSTLSGMAHLQSLSLHFLSTTNHIVLPLPCGERVVLPALTHLNFRGNHAYLEDLVARIDAPGLLDIEITFFNKRIFGASKLIGFIDRIEIQKSHLRADILSSERAISISLTQPGAPTCFKVQVSCEPLCEQVFSMAQICGHFSDFISRVEDLRINVTRPSSGHGGVDAGRLLDIFDSFTGVKWFHVAGNFSTDVVLALQTSERWRKNVLPALHKLCIREPEPHCAPLREAVGSFTHSHRLSGCFIAVEYERQWIGERRGTGHCSQQAAIEILPEDVLLNIFLHCLDASPQFWPTLTHVCQNWRRTVFASPRSLHLRLHYRHGMPVLKAPDCWPTLPFVVQYGGSPRHNLSAPKAEDNVVAVLKQSDRVNSINLFITSSLLNKLSTISEPFLELEELVLQSQENVQLTLPSTFRWGPRLRILHSTRIAFPLFPQLLLSSQDLVDLQLHEIPSAGYFSPEEFANALSGMTQLRSLSLHFPSLPPRSDRLGLPSSSEQRIVLAALAFLKYRGTSKYLDSLVARIDAPCLGDVDITFFGQPTVDASQLSQFIERIEILKTHSRADVLISGRAISISFLEPRAPTSLGLQISCEQLDRQLSSMGQICNHFTPFLFRVKDLRIKSTRPSSLQDDVDSRQWLDLVGAFSGTKDFRVAGELATDILCALRPVDGEPTTILPSLRNVCVPELRSVHGPLWEAAKSFITSRWPSGSSVHAVPSSTIFPALCGDEGASGLPSQYFCTLCTVRFTERQGLDRHIGDQHMSRILCPFCSDFEWPLGNNDIFREHLESKHPELTFTDALVA